MTINATIKLPGSLPLFTRMGREILNEQAPDPPLHKSKLTVEVHRKKFPFAQIRRPPTGQYNCHGLTFANRRTSVGLDDPDDAWWELLKADDGYREIKESEVEVGDIVVHFDGQGISHTGIVVEVGQGKNVCEKPFYPGLSR